MSQGTSQPMVTIRCRENGPLVVALDSGVPIRVIDHLGNAFTIPAGKTNLALCRCGQSLNKPFCDGTHKTCGFLAAEMATPVPPPATPATPPSTP